MGNRASPRMIKQKQDMGNGLRICVCNWCRMRTVLTKYKLGEQLEDDEILLLGDFQSFAKPGRRIEVATGIREQGSPAKNRQLCKMQYPSGEELARLVLRYQTYYTETYS